MDDKRLNYKGNCVANINVAVDFGNDVLLLGVGRFLHTSNMIPTAEVENKSHMQTSLEDILRGCVYQHGGGGWQDFEGVRNVIVSL